MIYKLNELGTVVSKIENEPVEEQEQDNEISVKEIEDTIQSKVSKISNRVDLITEKFVEYKKRNDEAWNTIESSQKDLIQELSQ